MERRPARLSQRGAYNGNMARKNVAAVAFGRSAKRTSKKVVRKQNRKATPEIPVDTSDAALEVLLVRLKRSADRDEIRRLSDQIERVVFHKQFANA